MKIETKMKKKINQKLQKLKFFPNLKNLLITFGQ